MIGLLGSSIARGVGGQLAKGAAKKAFSSGKNKKQSQFIKSPTQVQEQGKGNAIVLRSNTALIPAASIPARNNKTQVSGPSKSGPGTLERIDKEVLEIRNLLGKSIKEEKNNVKTKRKLYEKETRESKEKKLESKSGVGSGIGAGLKRLVPGGGIVDAIQNFIFSIIAGKILIFLFENRETVFNIVKGLAAATEFVITLGGKVLDGIISLVDGAYSITDAIGKEIEGVGGEDAGKEYNKFLGTFNKFLNLAIILAMSGVPGSIGGMTPKGKPSTLPKGKADKKTRTRADKKTRTRRASQAARKRYARRYGADAARQRFAGQTRGPMKGLGTGTGGRAASGRAGGVFRRGLGKSGSRLQTRIMGRGARLGVNRAGARLASKFAKIGSGPLGRIPIIGPLMIGIASYMEDADGDGQPDKNLSKALFKAGGSALGGFLGSFIPIPFLGTLIGTLAGEYVGDLMYTLLKGGGISEVGNRLKKDILKIVNGAKLFSEWMLKGISNIQKQDGPEINLSWVPGLNLGKIRIGGWATLLNPLEMNPLKKFDVLRKAFFSESDIGAKGSTYSKTQNDDGRGNSDSEGDESRSGGGAKPTVTSGSGRRSIPSGNGAITKVPFGDSNFSPGKTRGKSTQIYLHWTGGTYNDTSASYGYHSIFAGDGSIHRNKDYDVTGGHTEGKNSNSVGLSLAAMGGEGVDWDRFGSYPVTHEQLNAMTAEAARLAIKWGWSEGDINKNVWTHAEAGSGLDPRGLSGHRDMDGDGSPDNYGPSMWGGSVARWDLLNVTEGAEMGSGGSVARDMIKKHFRNFKEELKGEGSSRGNSDSEGVEAKQPSAAKPKREDVSPTSIADRSSGLSSPISSSDTKEEKEAQVSTKGPNLDFSSLKGSSGFTDIFAGAREHAATSAGQQSQFFKKPSSNSVNPSNITPVNLNSSDGLRTHTDYEEDGAKIVVVNQPYIINNNVNNDQPVRTSGSKYYT